MSKTIHFHGKLKDLCPDPIIVNAATVGQALDALKLHPQLKDRSDNIKYQAKIRGLDSIHGLHNDWPHDEIHLDFEKTVGRFSGSGGAIKNPNVRLVIGIIIIALAYVYGGPAGGKAAEAAAGAAASGLTTYGAMAMSFGISMAAGALTEILAPSPNETDEASNLATPHINTVSSGTSIPIILGEHLWGGHYISYNTNPQQAGSGWYPGGTGGNETGPGPILKRY